MSESLWFLYLIRCRNGTLYAGISTDVERRFAEHQAGAPKGARYLRGKGPLELVFQAAVGDRSAATKLEVRVKGLPRSIKEDVIAGNVELRTLLATNQELQHGLD